MKDLHGTMQTPHRYHIAKGFVYNIICDKKELQRV